MIDLAQWKVIIGERPFQDKAEILFQSAVIEIYGTGSIAKTTFFLATFEMEKKRPQFKNISLSNRDTVSILKPGTAFKDALEIAADGTWTVVDQFKDI